MKVCGNCGRQVPERGRFCSACGSTSLIESGPSTQYRDEGADSTRGRPWIKWVVIPVAALLVIGGGITALLLLTGDKKAGPVEPAEVKILKPGSHQVFSFDPDTESGATIDVEIECYGDFDKVDVYLDEDLEATVRNESYRFEIEDVAVGSHKIEARVLDERGATLSEGSVSVEVEEKGEPVEEDEFDSDNLLQFSNPDYDFAIDYPSGWEFSESDPEYGHRDKWSSPDGTMYFLVDSSVLSPGETDACETPRELDASSRDSRPDYALIKMEPDTFKGYDACVWEFSSTSTEDDLVKGQRIKKYDYFIVGEQYGYAVLFAARDDVYDEKIESWKDNVLESFEPDI